MQSDLETETNRFGGVGWAQPTNSRKFHAFDPKDGRALCAKWMFFGSIDTKCIGERGDDDCTVCRRKVDALIQRVNAEGRSPTQTPIDEEMP